jgi:hypothetical protein
VVDNNRANQLASVNRSKNNRATPAGKTNVANTQPQKELMKNRT